MENENRKPFSSSERVTPLLWVVALPIGHLGDLTPRAKQVLERADQVLCEDTRVTMQLGQAASVKLDPKRLVRWDQYVEKAQFEEFCNTLKGSNLELAIVSDAGTPGIQDPGAGLVREFFKRGWKVSPVPGPSSLAAFLSISGFQSGPIVFGGFFPRQDGDRRSALLPVRSQSGTQAYVWFESPERISGTIKSWIEALDDKNQAFQMCLAKELTKGFEKIWCGDLSLLAQVLSELEADPLLNKGEWVIGFQATTRVSDPDAVALDPKILHFLDVFMKENRGMVKLAELAKAVSQGFGVPREQVYKYLLSI